MTQPSLPPVGPVPSRAVTAPPSLADSLRATSDTAIGNAVPGLPLPRAQSVSVLAAAYRFRQLALGRQAAAATMSLWQQYIDPARFADSWRTLRAILMGIVSMHYDASAADAARYYMTARSAAGIGPFSVPGVTLDQQYASRVLGSMGPGMFFHFLKEQDLPVASRSAGSALQGSVTRLVLSGGRQTVLSAAQADHQASGWERIISPGACSFCAMLAGRGGVYSRRTVDFRAHDHCGCTAAVVFRGFQSSGTQLSQQWKQVTRGKSGAAARSAWDEYWSSRNEHTITGPASEAPPEGAGHAPELEQ